VTEVGRKLGVHYVVEGSVRKVGTKVRITAQLVDASTGAHIWAQRYDRDLEDIFAVQDEVSETVVGTLAGRLETAGVERARKKPTTSLTAFDYLLQGRDLVYRYSREDNAKARELLEKAIALDPDYAEAHAWLSGTYWADWARSIPTTPKHMPGCREPIGPIGPAVGRAIPMPVSSAPRRSPSGPSPWTIATAVRRPRWDGFCFIVVTTSRPGNISTRLCPSTHTIPT
jgi:hypothetical protein